MASHTFDRLLQRRWPEIEETYRLALDLYDAYHFTSFVDAYRLARTLVAAGDAFVQFTGRVAQRYPARVSRPTGDVPDLAHGLLLCFLKALGAL
jgi:hypothetical protein